MKVWTMGPFRSRSRRAFALGGGLVLAVVALAACEPVRPIADPWPLLSRVGDPALEIRAVTVGPTGTHVAFVEWAPDTDYVGVRLTNLLTGETEVIATADDLGWSRLWVYSVDVTAGGDEVVFDTGFHELWVWSRGQPELERVDVATDGTPIGGYTPSISDDGSMVVFSSRGDPDGTEGSYQDWDCFVRFRGPGARTERLWAPPGGDVESTFSSRTCSSPSVSADGSTAIVYLRIDGVWGGRGPRVVDIDSRESRPVAVRPDQQPVTRATAGYVQVSRTGRFLAFSARDAAELLGRPHDEEAPLWGIFFRDRDTDGNGILDEPGSTSTMMVAEHASPTNEQVAMSSDGSKLAFGSGAAESTTTVRVWDRASGTTESFPVAGDAEQYSLSGTGAVLSLRSIQCDSDCEVAWWTALPRHDGSGARLYPARSVLPAGATINVRLNLGTFGAREATQVIFSVVSGPNAGDGSLTAGCRSARSDMLEETCITDRNGFASWLYRGDGGVGTDVVRATVDANRNGTADPSETAYSAEVLWRDEVRYASIGDSYTSGEGVEPYRPGTATEDNRCHRSFGAYPGQIRMPGSPDLSTNPELDTIAHLARAGDAEMLAAACSMAFIRNLALDGMWNEEPQIDQFDNLSERPNVVTVGIGGNDALFSDILITCATAACTAEGFNFNNGMNVQDWLADFIANTLPGRLDDLLTDVRAAAAADASIMLVGYPQVFPDSLDEQRCLKLEPWLGKMTTLRERTGDFNDALEAAAARNGVHFVSLAERYAGHEVCGDEGELINGPTRPATWWDHPVSQGRHLRSFHPKRGGHGLAGDVISEFFNQWIEDGLPLNTAGFPQNPQAVPAARGASPRREPVSFDPAGSVAVTGTADPCSTRSYAYPGLQIEVTLDGWEPNETVALTLSDTAEGSQPISPVTVDGAGRAATIVTLPAGGTGGFRTLDARSADLSQLAVEPVQFEATAGTCAGDDDVTTSAGESVSIDLMANDASATGNVDPATAQVVTSGSGSATIDDGVLTYTPVSDFLGVDTFTYEVCDDVSSCDLAQVTIEVSAGCTLIGTAGDDSLVATDDRDVICAGAGNDMVDGRGGDDVILAGPGHDAVLAGPGDDHVLAGEGHDVVNGGPGDDRIDAGLGDNSVVDAAADDAPPEIFLKAPREGQQIDQGDDVWARYWCEDPAPASGVEDCTGTVPEGQQLDTGTLGAHTFAVQARDALGNEVTQTVTYQVVAPRLDVTLVVGDPDGLGPGDSALESRLTADHGARVRLTDGRDPPPDDSELIVVSGSANPLVLDPAYWNARVGVVNMDAESWDDMGASTEAGTTTSLATVHAAGALCPLTDGPAGTVTGPTAHVSSASATGHVEPTGLAPGAVTCLNVTSGASEPTGFVVDTNAALTDGAAPARRVALGFTGEAIGRLTAEGWLILDNAIAWAAGP